MSDGVLFQALIYLLAAVICVPIARRLGLGSVLGYLIAGVPSVLGLVGHGAHVMHFAEFGVVMMLFLVGLELRPSEILVHELGHRMAGHPGPDGGLPLARDARGATTGPDLWRRCLPRSHRSRGSPPFRRKSPTGPCLAPT